jgi:hypothetical protein
MALHEDSPLLVSAGLIDNGEAINCEKFGSCAKTLLVNISRIKTRV